MPIDIQPTPKPLGAEISGVDLSQDLPDGLFAEIYEAFINYKVLVFPNQNIEPSHHIAFSRRFGEPEILYGEEHRVEGFPEIVVLSNKLVDGKPIGVVAAGDFWHSDLSYKRKTSLATFLYAHKLPKLGGDTEFADMQNAYDTLPGALKERIQGLKGVHAVSKLRNSRVAVTRPDGEEYYTKQAGIKNRSHPLVRTHPESGRKGLYLSPRFTIGIEGMDDNEAQPLLDLLFDHLIREENVYRHKWRLGDFIFWDNRSVNHRACGGYEMNDIRLLHRTSTRGDQPYS
jgi:taurine dioxygenase